MCGGMLVVVEVVVVDELLDVVVVPQPGPEPEPGLLATTDEELLLDVVVVEVAPYVSDRRRYERPEGPTR